jgi:hypothetical protein
LQEIWLKVAVIVIVVDDDYDRLRLVGQSGSSGDAKR